MIVDLYFSILAVIAEIFVLLKNWQYAHKPTNPTTPTIPNNQVNEEIETQLLTAKTKIRKC